MMLSDVCLSGVRLSVWRRSVAYIGPKSRTERPRKTKIGTEIVHITCDSDTRGQSHEAALLTAALTRDAGAAMTTRTYWARESTATLRLLGGAWSTLAPTGEERGGGVSCPHAHCLLLAKLREICVCFLFGFALATVSYVNKLKIKVNK